MHCSLYVVTKILKLNQWMEFASILLYVLKQTNLLYGNLLLPPFLTVRRPNSLRSQTFSNLMEFIKNNLLRSTIPNEYIIKIYIMTDLIKLI